MGRSRAERGRGSAEASFSAWHPPSGSRTAAWPGFEAQEPLAENPSSLTQSPPSCYTSGHSPSLPWDMAMMKSVFSSFFWENSSSTMKGALYGPGDKSRAL